MQHKLYTAEAQSLGKEPWCSYPRPQMRRASFMSLNGQWDFTAVQGGFPERYDRKILLPFCPESRLSGIHEHFAEGTALCYRRKFTLMPGFRRERVLLHIGAADQHTQCFVNGKLVGRHSGGYDAMTFDITQALCEGENELRVRCFDDLGNTVMPYGKQTQKRGGMWYTPVSGIWQSVWLESVPNRYIERLKIENRGYGVTIDIGRPFSGKVIVPEIGEFPLVEGKVSIALKNPHLWSPEDPYLYDFTVQTEEDCVQSYFAIRALEIRKVNGYARLCLNGKPYFFHGLLDQGYWPDGLYTPATPQCFANDILAMKKLGFNTLRKHIKIEPEEFYYQCDKLGMIVFQDMVNNGKYHYGIDTILPTLSLRAQKALDDRSRHKSETQRNAFLDAMQATVRQLGSHPCIVYWTIFNEGWGQFDADAVYEKLRGLDDTRWIDTTSGWFRRKKTDVDSRHVYFRRIRLSGDGEKPLVISEFGGYACRIDGHIFQSGKSYGYGTYESPEQLSDAVGKLYREQVIPCIRRGACGAIYTQISDVEDEINGILTYDRKCVKLPPEDMQQLAQQIQSAIAE